MKSPFLTVLLSLVLLASAMLLNRLRRRRPRPLAFAGAGGGAGGGGGRSALSWLLFAVTGGTGAEGFNVQDAGLTTTLALPNAASTTVKSAAGFDLGETTALAINTGNWEFLLSAPALTTTMLPDTRTMTYNLVAADDAALSTNLTVIANALLVQVGAGGAGAPAAKARYRLPSVSQRYIGLQVVSGASTTDSSSKSATLAAVF